MATLAAKELPDQSEVFTRVTRAVAKRIYEDKPFLEIVADVVLSTPVTHAWVATLWDSLVEILVAKGDAKATTKSAWAFTKERLKRWPQQQKAWLCDEVIIQLAFEIHDVERATHDLTSISGLIDEVRKTTWFEFIS